MGPYCKGFLLIIGPILTSSPSRSDPPTLAATPASQGVKSAALDHYGDPLPVGVRSRMGTIRFRHGSQVQFLLFAPDGKTLASASADGSIFVWDTATGKELRQFKGRPYGSSSIVYSADSKILAFAGEDMTVQFWDLTTGKMLRQFAGPPMSFMSLAISVNGKIVAFICNDQCIRLWDAVAGKELTSIAHQQPANGQPAFFGNIVAFSPDSKSIAVGGNDGNRTVVRFWEAPTGKELQQWNLAQNTGIMALLFSPDGKNVAVRDGNQITRILDALSGKELRQFQGRANFGTYSDSFAPDGKTFASANGDQIHLEEVSTGKETRQIKANHLGVSALAYSPDGKWLASGGMNNMIRLWETASAKEHVLGGGHRGGIFLTAYSPDGKNIATVSADYSVRLWDADTGMEIRRFERTPPQNPNNNNGGEYPQGNGAGVAFSRDGKTLAAAWTDGLLQIWDWHSGKEIGKFHDSKGQFATFLTFSPDNKTLATGRQDGLIQLRDVATGKELRQIRAFKIQDPNGQVYGACGISLLTYSQDGKTLVAGGYELNPQGMARGMGMTPAIHILEVATGKERRSLPVKLNNFEPLPYMAFPGGGGWGGIGGMVWDVTGGAAPATTAAAFSPEGKFLALSNGNTIHLWDLALGKLVRSFSSHQFFSSRIAFSPNGQLLAAAGTDGTLFLWETATGTQLGQFEGHRGMVNAVAFGADAGTIISAGMDSTALVWDVATLLAQGPVKSSELSPQQLEDLWKDLADADAAKADRAIWTLAASPQTTIPFLKSRLQPVATLDSQRLLQLITDLENDQFDTRQRATLELEKLGELAEAALLRALQGKPSPEVRKRAEGILEKIQGPVTAPDTIRELRALEVLEKITTGESLKLLAHLGTGAPDARLTRLAQESQGRLALTSSKK
jgi:WD40 repeat protein